MAHVPGGIGIAKQVEDRLGMYWAMVLIGGKLITLTISYAAYYSGPTLLMPRNDIAHPDCTRFILQAHPDSLEHIHINILIGKLLRRYYIGGLYGWFNESEKWDAAPQFDSDITRHLSLRYYFCRTWDVHSPHTQYTNDPDHCVFIERMDEIVEQVRGVTEGGLV